MAADDKQDALQGLEAVSTAEIRAALEQGQRMFRAFRFASEVLTLVDNLQLVAQERQAAADAAGQAVAAAGAELEQARSDLAAAKAEAKEVRAKAKAAADAKVADAEARAAELVGDAEAKARAMTEGHEQMAAELLARQRELDELLAKMDQTRAQIAEDEAVAAAVAAARKR